MMSGILAVERLNVVINPFMRLKYHKNSQISVRYYQLLVCDDHPCAIFICFVHMWMCINGTDVGTFSKVKEPLNCNPEYPRGDPEV